jgi:hypothetical protein
LIKFFNQAIEDPAAFKLMLTLDNENKGVLRFVQNVGFKVLDMMFANFRPSDEETIKRHIKFRHFIARQELKENEGRLQYLVDLIAQKNPSLLQDLCQQIQAQLEPDTGSEAAPMKKKTLRSQKSHRSNGSRTTLASSQQGK